VLDNQDILISDFRAIIGHTTLLADGQQQILSAIGKKKINQKILLEDISTWFPQFVVCLPKKLN